jgi:hypothetical protein
MDETFELIQRYATERHELYRLAAKRHLTDEERSRLQELDSQLPVLWDRHRRELAARHAAPRVSALSRQAA